MTEPSVFNWLEIFRSPAAKIVEIHPANPHLSDGILRYRCSGKCAALLLSSTRELIGNRNQVNITLLLEGATPEIQPGDKLILEKQNFEIAKVELCRAFSGEVLARRCTIK